jgi:hypothetical protein
VTIQTRQVAESGPEHLMLLERLRRTQLPSQRTLLLVLVGLAAEIAIMYSRSINNGFIGDDWPLLDYANHGLGVAVAWHAEAAGSYHYNPMTQLFVLVLFQIFGLRPLVYHLVAFLFFWLDAALVVAVGRRITGSLSIGALAAALFIAFGNQYEAVIWGLVSFWQTMSLAVFLGGLLLYTRAHDSQLDQNRRRRSYIGFLIALVVAPFIYEPTVTLIVVCALYRFLVIEAKSGLSGQATLTRVKAWVSDFIVPAILFDGYLSMKSWMGRHTAVPMTPGLAGSLHDLALVMTTGLFRAFVPGLSSPAADRLGAGWGVFHDLRVTAAMLLVLLVSFVLVRPIYRFLLVWTVVLIVSITLGLGAIASRHLNLVLVPSAILWASFLFYLAAKVRSWLERSALPRGWPSRLALTPSLVLAIVFGVVGFRYAAMQQDAWAAAGRDVQDAVTQVGVYSQVNPTATTLYVVDVPDSFSSSTSDTVYVIRNVPQVFVNLAYPGRFKNVIAVRTYEYGFAKDYSVLATDGQIAQWSRQPDTLVLWYDNSTHQLRQWAPSSAKLFTPLAG